MRVRAEPKNNFDDFSFVCKCVQLPGGASGTVHWESSDTDSEDELLARTRVTSGDGDEQSADSDKYVAV